MIMKKQLFSAILFLLLFVAGLAGLQAQIPTFLCEAKNDAQITPKIYEFDIWITPTLGSTIDFAGGSYGIVFPAAFKNSGTITIGFIGDDLLPHTSNSVSGNCTSTFPFAYQPSTIGWTATQNCVKISGKTPPGAGGCVFTTAYKVCRVRMTNSVNFGSGVPSTAFFNMTATPYLTANTGYISGINTPITPGGTYTVTFTTYLNPPAPTAYALTPSATSYCAGTGGIILTLANSQSFATYQLYNGLSLVGPSQTGNTGNPLTWNGVTAGSYTVLGTSGGGSTQMNTIPVGITENPQVGGTALITGNQQPIQGSSGNIYSVSGITGAVNGYHWVYSTPGDVTFADGGSTISVSYSTTAGTGYFTVQGLNLQCGAGLASAPYNITPKSALNTWTGLALNQIWFDPANWSNNAVPSAGDNIDIPAVASLPVISGSTLATCNNAEVHIGASITVAGKLTVVGILTMDGGVNLIVSDGGSFIENGLAGSGTATVQRTMEAGKWHYISSPITHALSGDFYQDFLTTYSAAYGLAGWLPANYMIDPGLLLNPGQGYATYIMGNNPKTFSGILNTSATNYPCVPQSIPSAGIGYNLVGNEYPCSIDLANLAIIWPGASRTAWFWNPTEGNYDVYPALSPYTTHDQYAPVAQGFFLATDNGVGGNFSVPRTARVHSTTAFLKDNGTAPNFLKIRATSQMNSFADNAIVGFMPETTTGYDVNYDAEKLVGGNDAPQLYTLLQDNRKMNFNIQPAVNANTIIPMGFSCSVNGSYNLNASNLESFDAATRIYLEDLKEGTIQDLKANPAYSFNYTTGDAANRFVLHFSITTGINDLQANGVQVYTYENSLYIKNLDNQSLKNVFVYDLLGKQVFQSALNQSPLQKFVLGVNDGYYVVKVVSTTGVTTRKVYIN
jgi:hypothetical protein